MRTGDFYETGSGNGSNDREVLRVLQFKWQDRKLIISEIFLHNFVDLQRTS